MLKLPKNIASLMPAEQENHRGAGRLHCQGLRSSLGPVLDLSATGMMVLRKKDPTTGNTPLVVWLESPSGDRVFLRAELKRHERLGWRRHHAAYEFIDLSEEKKLALMEIARCSIRYEYGLGDRKAG